MLTPRNKAYVMILGVLVLLLLVVAADIKLPDGSPLVVREYWYTLQSGSIALRGWIGGFDIYQDIVGFRALVNRTNAYPVLGTVLPELGVDWNIIHASTHPPTAYLFCAPIAFLPLSNAVSIWAWMMVLCLGFAVWCVLDSWRLAVGLTPFLLFWPPITTSLGQFTILWLLASAMVYRWQKTRPRVCGAMIGIASLTKFFPGLMLIVFVVKRQWRAVLALILVWLVAVVLIYGLHPQAISQYITANFLEDNADVTIARQDNSSLLVNGYTYLGIWGVVLIVSLFGGIGWTNRNCILYPVANAQDFGVLASYFSVALLPISWVYSIAPQLLVIWYLQRKQNIASKILAGIAFVLPFFFPAYGEDSVLALVLVNMLLGIGLLMMNLRLPSARSS